MELKSLLFWMLLVINTLIASDVFAQVSCQPYSEGRWCDPGTNKYIDFVCGCENPGNGWVPQDDNCYHRLSDYPCQTNLPPEHYLCQKFSEGEFCNSQLGLVTEFSCGCSESPVFGWVDQGMNCYHRIVAKTCNRSNSSMPAPANPKVGIDCRAGEFKGHYENIENLRQYMRLSQSGLCLKIQGYVVQSAFSPCDETSCSFVNGYLPPDYNVTPTPTPTPPPPVATPTPAPTPPPPPPPPETGPDLDILGRLIPTVTIEQMTAATQYGYLCEHIGGQRTPGVGPGPCGSFQVVDNSCSAGMESSMTSWQTHLGTFGFTSGTSLSFALPSYNVKIFKYRTPVEGEARPNGASTVFPLVGSVSWEEQYNRGPLASVFIALSKKRCDFDYTKLEAGDPCYKSAQSGGVIPATVAYNGQIIPAGNCRLDPNTDYYVSIRWENPTLARDRGDGIIVGGNRGKDSCNQLWGLNQDNTFMRNYCGMVFLTNF